MRARTEHTRKAEHSDTGAFFQVTHPFHPLHGETLERASGPPQESHRFVFFHTADGRLGWMPLKFTDLVAPDPFVVVSGGRAYLRLEDLLELSSAIGSLWS